MPGDELTSRVSSQTVQFSKSWRHSTEKTTNVYFHDKRDSTLHSEDTFPFFEDDDVFRNVTAQLGNDVYLHCRVNDLADKTVIGLLIFFLIYMTFKLIIFDRFLG